MDQVHKDTFFKRACASLEKNIQDIKDVSKKIIQRNNIIRKELHQINEDDKLVQQRILEYGVERVDELEVLEFSPYFVRCVVDFKDDEKEIIYFGKFSFIENNIYSWITPASSIRFEKPGEISYIRPDGRERTGILVEKDQYMIVDGKIVYLSTESLGNPRELIYQEYFSKQKKGFILPEIIAQMEKAQDTVIRAHHKDAMLISGPAGSGKTTLALHRVAYLAQSPDVSDEFKPTSIIIFVEDTGTMDYFSHLLPELGIKGVHITTFALWAMKALDLADITYVYRFGENEQEKDLYEFKKKKALETVLQYTYSVNIFRVLKEVYASYFSQEEKRLFEKQKKQKVLDRFDLTVLLMLFKKKYGKLSFMQGYYQMNKSRAAKKKTGRFPIEYSLMIFDEFQNYIPEQILLAKSTVNKKHNAIMYVGDLAQQTKLGTLQSWTEVDEILKEDRCVILQKVYRNTKNILEYIQAVGYEIDISEKLREGEAVIEKMTNTKQEEITYITSLHENFPEKSIGVITKDKEYLDVFKEWQSIDKVHLMSIHEAQGVEFDIVCIVGVQADTFSVHYDNVDDTLIKAKNHVNRDLLYVALTRAIDSLHVLGRVSLKGMMERE
ncbi:MAG: AAA family ATPase [Candidatus Magasanikbacteria bacterium]|jgi:DNA helicase IV|nr:AAA family ATPase [Candidatus Magasanikbacteria bacterium]MBT4071795.1 AAA family ATPase [Candidatus Magasanikbacteria bacterium]